MADPATVQRAEALFEKTYGGQASIVTSAPGRVNLIGEHTDYNDGFVMPLALSKMHTVVAGRKTDAGKIRVVTESQLGDTSTEFAATKREDICASKEPRWCNYIKGVIYEFFSEGGEIPSFDIAVATDVPLGGGLSSSASLEVAVCTFLEALSGRTLGGAAKALLCQRAENVHVGVPCGIMDQAVSVLAHKGHALLLDCRTQETQYVPLTNDDVIILVINSNVKHELTGGEYAQRRAQCYEAVDVLKKLAPAANNIRALRDVTPAQVAAAAPHLTPTVHARARHVVGEDARTHAACDALTRHDYVSVGKHMHASHVSLRDDYEVSCEELDILVEAAMEVEGVYGSRMTGGGFGGCTVTLLRADALARACAHVAEVYTRRTGGRTCTWFATTPGEGAAVIRK